MVLVGVFTLVFLCGLGVGVLATLEYLERYEP